MTTDSLPEFNSIDHFKIPAGEVQVVFAPFRHAELHACTGKQLKINGKVYELLEAPSYGFHGIKEGGSSVFGCLVKAIS